MYHCAWNHALSSYFAAPSLATPTICAILLWLVIARFLATETDYLQTVNIQLQYNDRYSRSGHIHIRIRILNLEEKMEDKRRSIFAHAGSHNVYLAMSHMQYKE